MNLRMHPCVYEFTHFGSLKVRFQTRLGRMFAHTFFNSRAAAGRQRHSYGSRIHEHTHKRTRTRQHTFTHTRTHAHTHTHTLRLTSTHTITQKTHNHTHTHTHIHTHIRVHTHAYTPTRTRTHTHTHTRTRTQDVSQHTFVETHRVSPGEKKARFDYSQKVDIVSKKKWAKKVDSKKCVLNQIFPGTHCNAVQQTATDYNRLQ